MVLDDIFTNLSSNIESKVPAYWLKGTVDTYHWIGETITSRGLWIVALGCK